MRVALALVLASLSVTATASAEQFVLVDADYTHTKESHAYAKPKAGQPSNWRTPINYAEGTAYYRLEVFEKPSDENLNMGVCFVGVSYCCFGYQRFTKPGVYEWSFAIPSMWQYDKVDFTKPMTEIPFIMRDRAAIKVDPGIEKFYGNPSTALYFPMKSHLTVTIVSKGSTYVKPAPDAGAPDTSVDASADSAAADTAGGETEPVETDTGATTVEDTGTTTASDTGAAVDPDAATPAADGDALEGSSCAMGHGHADGAVAILAILGAWRMSTQYRRSRSGHKSP